MHISTGYNETELPPPQSSDDSYYGNPNDDVDYYIPDVESLYEFGDPQQIRLWLNEWREMRMADQPDDTVRSWFQNLRRLHGPRIIGYEQCTQDYENLLIMEPTNLPFMGTLYDCGMSGCLK